MIPYEDFEQERLDPIYDIVAPYSEMDKNQRYFLNGLIRSLKPKKILEVGVSSGGGSAIILNAISDIDDAKLYSVDYLEKAYRHPEKPSGFIVEEKFPKLMDKWKVYRGGDISCFIEDIGGDIDFLMLDSAHVHPWETLNFLCVLPFMKNFSYAAVHDLTLFVRPGSRFSSKASCYLFASVVSDQKIKPVPSDIDNQFAGIANMGAFRVSEDTRKYVDNLFECLFFPWDTLVSKKDIDDVSKIIKKYYSTEQYHTFCDVVKFQDYIIQHPASLRQSLRFMLQNTMPNMFESLRKMKSKLKG